MAYDLSKIVEQRTEAVGGEHVEFTWAGETFSMPHPMLADDSFKDEFSEAAQSNNDIEIARVCLGEEQYERFRAAGGRASYIALLMEQVGADTQAESNGRPTRSSSSSATTRKRRKQT